MANLFSPIKIGDVEVKNRFMLAPMENGLAEIGGVVSDRLINFYVDRVRRGVAIIDTGSITISPEGAGLPTQMGIYDEKFYDGLKRMNDAVHEAGGKISAQLYHAGRQATKDITGLQPIAPSAVPCAMLGNDPREMTREDMDEIKEKFVHGATKAVELGFDIIEIHFAHGYLIHSFLSPHSNKREDEYGGSFENRMRYPMELWDAIMKAVDGKVPVMIRVSVDEYLDDGFGFEEVKKACKILVEKGCAAVSLTAGSYDSIDYAIQPMYIKQGFLVPYSEKLKKELDVPIIVAARLNNAKLIEDIIENDKADMVAIGRGLIADENLITNIKDKNYDDIKYCIACNQGCIDNVLQAQGINCLENARTSYEDERNITKTETPKNVVVIGGGPAGMEAARVATLRGHNVTLLEKNKLGGKMNVVSIPPEKDTFDIYKNYLLRQMEKLGITIIKKEVNSAADIKEYSPDTIIVATGGAQDKPPIDGVDGSNVVFAEDILTGKVKPADEVAIIGGGLVGTETAKFLGDKGIKVHLIEMTDAIAKDIGGTYIGHLFDKLNEYGVDIHTSCKANKITADGVVAQCEAIPAKQVIIATGYKACNKLLDELKKEYKNVIGSGDVNNPRRIIDGVRESYLATYKL